MAQLTTLGVGGELARYVEATGEAEFLETIREADATGTPVLVLGGGSNIVAPDEGFDGVVVRDVRDDIEVVDDTGCGGATVRVAAGVGLDALVARAIEEGWMGLEALSGIPGTVGAAPVQNVGAYGHEIAEVISSVSTLDRLTGQRAHLALAELGLGYRTSRLKRERVWGQHSGEVTPRWVITSVEFAFRHASLSAPIAYAQLADALGVEVGDRVDAAQVREAVLALRASKGMVLDERDPDARSAGSFFTNPVLSAAAAAALPAEAPRFPVYDYAARRNIADAPPLLEGVVKTSAAWLIEHAGISRGFALRDDATAAISSKHTLALTTRGSSPCSADVRELAEAVVERVRERFGVTLVPEPALMDRSGTVAITTA
ncbi:UDP-N-acetylmuramate dehydrogenase [Nanchangia anserum]|uniref:UDP-N-acetylenolpyruvoylglucosamine reductase n=1 Tax=Nanchangia anserum TaxID=2692125 RepID=A0A8I0G7L2_9ACTO|nr:UDP-N-acetylmuramate dehydrogenase [Nanchangia anserum]QOX82643.1 UDP-N-acetylmuramate dehydrogenase [Nanchangia anserum]